VFRGRTVIPSSLQTAVLKSLHLTHPGIVRMKAFARQYVYWPGIGSDIEAMVRLCGDCQSAAKLPVKQPLQPWTPSNKVFERIHIYFAGPCSDGNTYIIIVDSYSKWPEISLMSSTSSVATIKVLRHLFDRSAYHMSSFPTTELNSHLENSIHIAVMLPAHHPLIAVMDLQPILRFVNHHHMHSRIHH
jgi:hypothetical protein